MCILGLLWLISYGFLERCGTPALSYLGGVVGAQGGGVCAFTCAPLRRGSRELGAGEDGSPSPHCLLVERGRPSVWLAVDLGRGFATESLVRGPWLASTPSEQACAVSWGSRSFWKQPFAEEAQITFSALRDPWNTLAFNF